jgi:YegS/Rv2252/BmrU family lipid kinase
VQTSARGDATRLARDAALAGKDALLVAGGDGTINEAIQALKGSDTALGYLPQGTVNVWAREIGMPLQPSLAARALTNSRRRLVDLGIANGRCFLLMASVGFDGKVLHRIRGWEHHKRRFGILPYVAGSISIVPFYRGADFELRYDGLIRRVQALMIVVSNTRLYGGRFYLTPQAVANDGWLDACIVKGRSPLALVRQALPLLLSGSIRHSDVELLRVKELTIRADVQQPLQVDGELVGKSPVTVSVVPAALQVLVPVGFTSDLVA